MLDRQGQLDTALELRDNPELQRAFDAATQDRDLWAQARENPGEFLRSQGVELPDDFRIQFLGDPHMPPPDFEIFTVRLFNCRTFAVKKKDEPGYEIVEACFGFELIPNGIPVGPRG